MILKTDKSKVIVAVFKIRDPGAGEMAQSLKCTKLLFWGLGFLPFPHLRGGLTAVYNSSSRGSDALFRSPQHEAHGTDTHAGKTSIHIKK